MITSETNRNADDGARGLASWIVARVVGRPSRGGELTHLKLQKLCFYGYGALLAEGLEGEAGRVRFEAWPHGPVSPAVYAAYRARGSAPISEPHGPATVFSSEAERTLDDILNVYGRLSAWALREESHLEAPWIATYEPERSLPIDDEHLRVHFKAKFAGGAGVAFPERLFGSSSFRLDRIPVPTFGSLRAMSEATTRILG
jgi:uncharacterized phage-associated protein